MHGDISSTLQEYAHTGLGAGAQVKAKYNATMAELFREAFCWLPLAHCLNGKVLVVHGGLFSRDGVTLDELRAIDRCRCAPASRTGSHAQLSWKQAASDGIPEPAVLGCQASLSVGCVLHRASPVWRGRFAACFGQ